MEFLPWEIRVAFPGESQLRQSRAIKPLVHAGFFFFVCVCVCFRNPPNSDMDYRIFNVSTDVNACNCTRRCTDTRKRVCTESWLWEENPLLHRGIEPASAAWRSDALPMSYILNPSALFFSQAQSNASWSRWWAKSTQTRVVSPVLLSSFGLHSHNVYEQRIKLKPDNP